MIRELDELQRAIKERGLVDTLAWFIIDVWVQTIVSQPSVKLVDVCHDDNTIDKGSSGDRDMK